MPLIRVQHYPGVRQVLIASEAISHLAVVEIATIGSQYVRSARDDNPERVAGVCWGGVSSGQIARIVVEGVISGVICASSINAGDRIMAASGGRITPFNTITPAGAVSGYVTGSVSGYVPAPPIDLVSGGVASGSVTVGIGALACTSGLISGLTGVRSPVFSSGAIAVPLSSGSFGGTAFNTGRVLGRALASGALGSGIPVLIALAG